MKFGVSRRDHPFSHAQKRRRAECGCERIHPRFLAVVDQCRMNSGEEGGGSGGGGVEVLFAEPIDQGDENDSGKGGESAQGKFALTERRPPGAKNQIVSRRMNVPRSPGKDQVNAPLGDARAVAFVIPERLRLEAVETEENGEEEDEEGEEFFHRRVR